MSTVAHMVPGLLNVKVGSAGHRNVEGLVQRMLFPVTGRS